MHVSGDEYHAVGSGASDQIVEPLPLQGKIAPRFHALLAGDDLGARTDDPQICRQPELRLQPGPLIRAQHRAGRVLVGHIPADQIEPGLLLCRPRILGGPAAEVAEIQQDDLHPFPFRPKPPGFVNAGTLPARGIKRNTVKIQHDLLRLHLPGITGSAIVHPVVVIIPGRQHRTGFPQRLEARLGPQIGILGLHYLHVGGIPINVIPDREEQFRLHLHDLIPNRLRFVLGTTRSKGNPFQHLRRCLLRGNPYRQHPPQNTDTQPRRNPEKIGHNVKGKKDLSRRPPADQKTAPAPSAYRLF